MNYRFHSRNAARYRYRLSLWVRVVAVSVWFLAVVVLLTGVAGAFSYPEIGGYDSEQNHPSYWGEDCDKTEDALQGPSWVADVDYRLIVLKSGTDNDLFHNVKAWTAVTTASGKDISHVIRCGKVAPPTTTLSPTTTTTTTEAPPPPPPDVVTDQPPIPTIQVSSPNLSFGAPTPSPLFNVPVSPSPVPTPFEPTFTG